MRRLVAAVTLVVVVVLVAGAALVITRGSAERLRLRVGDMVYAVIKSTEVMIGKGHPGS